MSWAQVTYMRALEIKASEHRTLLVRRRRQQRQGRRRPFLCAENGKRRENEQESQ